DERPGVAVKMLVIARAEASVHPSQTRRRSEVATRPNHILCTLAESSPHVTAGLNDGMMICALHHYITWRF
ncbi:MAG: hypothetical protein LC114_15280, partial [Bryobacterales bacterium]|nr:hypothetical protein [Bryobacterales bacterium]